MRILAMIKALLVLLLCALPALSQEIAPATPLGLVAAARSQIGKTVVYDPAYASLPYPKGDVPLERGVCCDVVIRAMRAAGVDLQQVVHEDMKANFSVYPKIWKLTKTDTNIDHRRVPNLVFRRRNDRSFKRLSVSSGWCNLG